MIQSPRVIHGRVIEESITLTAHHAVQTRHAVTANMDVLPIYTDMYLAIAADLSAL